MKQQFMNDLQRIYDELQRRQEELNNYYQLLEGEHIEASRLVENFLSQMELPVNKETQMAGLTRLVNLREDALEQVLEKRGFFPRGDYREERDSLSLCQRDALNAS